MIHAHGFDPMRPAILASGVALSAGAALLPDLDAPGGTASNAIPFGRTICRGIAKLAEGHRQATHSLIFAGVCFAEAWLVTGWAAAVTVGFLLAFAFRLLYVKWWWAIGAAAALVHFVPLGHWLAVAVLAGVAGGIGGDMLTPSRCPIFWPLPWRVGIPLFHTGGTGERFAGLFLWTGTAWLAWLAVMPLLPVRA